MLAVVFRSDAEVLESTSGTSSGGAGNLVCDDPLLRVPVRRERVLPREWLAVDVSDRRPIAQREVPGRRLRLHAESHRAVRDAHGIHASASHLFIFGACCIRPRRCALHHATPARGWRRCAPCPWRTRGWRWSARASRGRRTRRSSTSRRRSPVIVRPVAVAKAPQDVNHIIYGGSKRGAASPVGLRCNASPCRCNSGAGLTPCRSRSTWCPRCTAAPSPCCAATRRSAPSTRRTRSNSHRALRCASHTRARTRTRTCSRPCCTTCATPICSSTWPSGCSAALVPSVDLRTCVCACVCARARVI